MNKYIIICAALAAIQAFPAFALSSAIGGGAETLKCMCPDGTGVTPGTRCPDGTICGGLKYCTDCLDSDWSSYSTGCQKKLVANCNTSTGVCTKSATYRCAPGFYGASGATPSICTRCQTCPANSPTGATSAGGAEDETGCYLTENARGTDESGSFETGNQKCYYSNFSWSGGELKPGGDLLQ